MEKQGQSEMMPRFVYIKCPVCGKHEFDYYRDDGDACPVCGWLHDTYQEEYPDEGECTNIRSLNENREAYKNGDKCW